MYYLKKNLCKRVYLIVLMSIIGALCYAQAEINNIVDLDRMLRGDLNGNFIQTRDINVNEFPGYDTGWTPIGDTENPFTGTYDGNGFYLSGLTINSALEQSRGLFGVTSGATIKNLDLVGISFSCTFSGLEGDVGALVARAQSFTTIHNCYSAGEIKTDYGRNIGGLVGTLATGSSISYSNSSVTISPIHFHSRGPSSVGGLVGFVMSETSLIQNSFSTGSVTVMGNGGGFIGFLSAGTIINCYSRGNVISSYDINNATHGGFVGGRSGGFIENCYSTGSVPTSSSFNVGGFIGSNSYGNVTNSYYDINTANSNRGLLEWKKTTSNMKGTGATGTYVDWDFNTVWLSRSNTYPELRDPPADIINPKPSVAFAPTPDEFSVGIPVNLHQLGWAYLENEDFTNPDNFRVYFNSSDNFSGVQSFETIGYVDQQVGYTTSLPLPIEMDYSTTYYWKVVPFNSSGDAANVPVWFFTTEGLPENTSSGNVVQAPEADPNDIYIAEIEETEIVFIPDETEEEVTEIEVLVSTNPEINPISQGFSQPEALGKYFKFTVTNTEVVRRGTIQLEFDVKPIQIWYRSGNNAWDVIPNQVIDWADPLKPRIPLSYLLPAIRSGEFEIAGDNGIGTFEIIDLETPLLSIEKTVIGQDNFIRLEWDQIANANSYKIYTSTAPYTEELEWTLLHTETEELFYQYLAPQSRTLFYRVIASTEE